MIIIKFGENLIDEFVISLESKLLEGSLEFLRVNNTTAVVIEDIECSFDIFDFFKGDENGGVVLSFEDFFLGYLGWLGGSFCCRFSGNFAHYLKISNEK